MSVVLSKRKESALNVFKNALDLRMKITNLLLRDFGVKDKIRNLVAASGMVLKGMTKEDYRTLDAIYRKYDIGRPFIDRYPKWILDYFRTNILEILKNLIWNITAANTIYAVHEAEVYERRRYQTQAIINCEQLLQEFQYIIYIIPVNIEKLLPYVDMIENELRMLKSWRKDCNRLLKMIKEKRVKSSPAAESEANVSENPQKRRPRRRTRDDNPPVEEIMEDTSVLPEDRYDSIYNSNDPATIVPGKEPPMMTQELAHVVFETVEERIRQREKRRKTAAGKK